MSFARSGIRCTDAPLQDVRRRPVEASIGEHSPSAALSVATTRWPPPQIRGKLGCDLNELASQGVPAPASFSSFARFAEFPPRGPKCSSITTPREIRHDVVVGGARGALHRTAEHSATSFFHGIPQQHTDDLQTSSAQHSFDGAAIDAERLEEEHVWFEGPCDVPVSGIMSPSPRPMSPHAFCAKGRGRASKVGGRGDEDVATQCRKKSPMPVGPRSGSETSSRRKGVDDGWRGLSDVESLIRQEAMLIAEVAWWQERAGQELRIRESYEAEMEAQRKCAAEELESLRAQLRKHEERLIVVTNLEEFSAMQIASSQADIDAAQELTAKFHRLCEDSEDEAQRLRSELMSQSPQMLGPSADLFRNVVGEEISRQLYPCRKVDKLFECVEQVIGVFEQTENLGEEVLSLETFCGDDAEPTAPDAFPRQGADVSPHPNKAQQLTAAATKIQSRWRRSLARSSIAAAKSVDAEGE